MTSTSQPSRARTHESKRRRCRRPAAGGAIAAAPNYTVTWARLTMAQEEHAALRRRRPCHGSARSVCHAFVSMHAGAVACGWAGRRPAPKRWIWALMASGGPPLLRSLSRRLDWWRLALLSTGALMA